MSDRKPDESLPHRSLSGNGSQAGQPGGRAGTSPGSTNPTRAARDSASGSSPGSASPARAARDSAPGSSPSTNGSGRAAAGDATRSTGSGSTASNGGPATAAMPRIGVSGPGPAAGGGAATATATAPTRAAAVREQAPPKPAKPKRQRRPVRTRRARLRVIRVDPWSVMKLSFALSIAVAIVTVVAVAIVWSVLGAAGVWDSINSSVASVLQNDTNNFDVTNYVGIDRIMGFTLVIAAADIVLVTAIATLGAFLYNLSASLLGGLEVTLAEDL